MGIWSFEDGGNPVQMDRLMAGTDPVLMDAYVCRMHAVIKYKMYRILNGREAWGWKYAIWKMSMIRELMSRLMPMQKNFRNQEPGDATVRNWQRRSRILQCLLCLSDSGPGHAEKGRPFGEWTRKSVLARDTAERQGNWV